MRKGGEEEQEEEEEEEKEEEEASKLKKKEMKKAPFQPIHLNPQPFKTLPTRLPNLSTYHNSQILPQNRTPSPSLPPTCPSSAQQAPSQPIPA